jgi:RHS repeat-associated protein
LTDSSGTTTYTWNARDQFVSLSGPSVTASFQYDAVGRRKSKTVNGTTTTFLYDGLNVVQELNGTTPIANLITSLGIDETLLRTDAAGPRSFLTDGLGSTLALTDSAGLVQGEYTYEPFGKTTATGIASTNAFKYTGREDDGTGLYYYRARYYHPALQRLVSEDPIGFNGGDVNLYAYVFNDPVNFVDPTGEAGESCQIGEDPCPPPKKKSKLGMAVFLACRLFFGGPAPKPHEVPRHEPAPYSAPKDPPKKK